MNPTSGSFTINPRLQRHFSVFAVSFPGLEALQTIYFSILTQYTSNGFALAVAKYSMNLVNAALVLPTALKFHYIFNLRDISNIF